METNSQKHRLEEAIAILCKRVEALAPGSRTGVCIASSDGAMLQKAVFPNFPSSFQSAIREIPMGPPYFGKCTAAMDGHRIITTEDFETESRFDSRFIAHCLGHRPVYGEDRRPLGTFVMGFSEPRAARDFDEALVLFAADAVSGLLQEAARS